MSIRTLFPSILSVGLIGSTIFTGLILESKVLPNCANQQEAAYLSNQCAKIFEYFSAIGGRRSSACKGAIAQYLQSVGTTTALQMLSKYRACGEA